MKLLIADDDPVSRKTLQTILSNAGHEVTEATDGTNAWQLLSQPAHGFDAAFFDLEMPGMNGLMVTRRLRRSDANRALPVILCTSANDRHTVAKAASAGVRHYIVKPAVESVVLAKLALATRSQGSGLLSRGT